MGPHTHTLPSTSARLTLPRLTVASSALLNRISRRALALAALLAGVIPACLLAAHPGPPALWLSWLGAYGVTAALWLRDATSESPTFLPLHRALARHPMPSKFVAALYGAACGVPVLLLHDSADDLARASATILNLCIVILVSAANLKKPASSLWFARTCLGMLLAGWLPAQDPTRAHFLVHIAAAWAFSEILARRAAFLKRRFSQMAVRHGQAMDALRLKSQELENSTSNRVRILGTVSHEIRQPVHALGMMVERLRIDPNSIEFRPQLDEVAAVVRSLAHSLALLLDISRLDAGTVKVKTSLTSLQVLLERLNREFGFDARRKGLTLECHSDSDVRIETDFALFYGVVANFVSNAIRYTDRGYIKVFTSPKSTGEIWIHVRDSGRGIPQSRLQDIFDEYVRLDRENQAAQGFGLGLAIVRRTAALLGLEVSVESQVGVGSEFRVSVRCSSLSQAAAAAATPATRQSTVSRSLVGLRVVLVDNDAAVLRGIDSIVRSWGCVPLACQSVDELAGKLSLMPGIAFDCIVADYHLGPGQPNGLAAIELVRHHVQHFVSATIFTGDLNIRPADLPLPEAHKPVVPARISVMFEEMAAETRRRRPEADALSEPQFDDAALGDAMPAEKDDDEGTTTR
jgi:signal transduction histidine kinase/CheY-like chemotaxis protein